MNKGKRLLIACAAFMLTCCGHSGNAGRSGNTVKARFAAAKVSSGPEKTEDYYRAAEGKKGAGLKTAMGSIIYNRKERQYNELWSDFKKTDMRSDGKIWDIYSGITAYEPVTKGKSYSKEGDCYNREHSFPNSWFGGTVPPMYTDLHHIYPTDGYVNNRRGNYPFGETEGERYKSEKGFSKLGRCTYPGYSGIVFEPNDEFKGDLARTYFYMVTCYEEKLADWFNKYGNKGGVRQTIDGTTYPGLTGWQLEMLMKWAAADPVSEKEVQRNNAVYEIQRNRNPFIDFPGLERYIWGDLSNVPFSPASYNK